MSSDMFAPVLTRTSTYLFSISHLSNFHWPVVLSDPVIPRKMVRFFSLAISAQILATSPSFLPWKPVCAISPSRAETLLLRTSIVATGLDRTSFLDTTARLLENSLNCLTGRPDPATPLDFHLTVTDFARFLG